MAKLPKTRFLKRTSEAIGPAAGIVEVDTLFALTEHAEQTERPEGLVIADEIAFRHERLANLAQAKAV
jgi:hypothetical protein